MSIETILLIVLGIVFSVVVILWVEGIDFMNKNYPDYKGEGFLEDEKNEDRKDYDED
jgi:hypothetical protein